MYFEINNSLKRNNDNILKLLKDFSDEEILKSNELPNPFFKYLKFNSDNEFLLGDKRFQIRFENYVLIKYSKLFLNRLIPSLESPTGLSEGKYDLNIRIDELGNFYFNDLSLMSHQIGITFFSELEKFLNR